MSVARYSFINAKIRSMKADILTSEQWDALIGARDMFSALRILDATSYAQLVQDMGETTSPIEVERVLQLDFNKVLIEIKNDIPTANQTLMTWITRKFQKEVVKSLLRLFTSGSDQATAERLLIPLEPFSSSRLMTFLEAKDLRSMVSQIPDQFFQLEIQKTLPQYEETGNLFIVEHTLDTTVFQNLFREVQQLEEQDREITARLVGTEIDLLNLMITLRSHFLGFSSTETEELLIKTPYRLPLDLCQRALLSRNLEERIRILQSSYYRDLISRSWEAYELDQGLGAFEHNAHVLIRTDSEEAMIGYPFHFGIVLGFLNLKWYETINLKAVMNGKADQLDSNIIRRALIL
ncbi:MAG: V-type ATPase subunit [Promethearchaeota archaeon]